MSGGLEIQFYHLQSSPLEKALPKLLEKIHQRGLTCLVKTSHSAQSAQLSEQLWSYDPASFLPHGTAQEKYAESQPILLSDSLSDLYNKSILCLTDGTYLAEIPEGLSKVLDLFHGADTEAVQAARIRWKQYKDAGFSISYYQQNEAGAWQKKA